MSGPATLGKHRPCVYCAFRTIRIQCAYYTDESFDKIQLRPSGRRKLEVSLDNSRRKITFHLRGYLKYLDDKRAQFDVRNWTNMLEKIPEIMREMSKTDSNVKTVTNTKPVPDNAPPTSGSQILQMSEMDDSKLEQKTAEPEETYNIPLIGWSKADKPQVSKWTETSTGSYTNIAARTKHLLTLIANAETNQSRLKRLEDLISHLIKHEDSQLVAVKEGAIRKLLHIRSKTKDYSTHRVLREALALLGHIDPLPCKGIRILTIDGGGIRGLVVVDMLKKLEELTGKRIHELFDYICGVSTGSILVSCIGTPRGITLDDALTMYTEFGTKLFTQSAFWGVSNLVWSRAYYDTTMFEQLLKKFVGEMPLIKTNRDFSCPKIASVSTIMNQTSIMPYVFRNYALPCNRQSQYLGSCKYTLFESVRASGAAPTVFQEICLDGIVHQDGGILMNNPCALAIHEAKLLWPHSEIQCVVSCGTGRHTPLAVSSESSKLVANPSTVSWKTLFNRILESATDTEGVHTMLNDLLPPNVYFRFNPYLTELLPMHENRPGKITQLREDTGLYIRRNEEKFVDAAQNLLIKRTAMQKFNDFLELKSFEYGIRDTACKL